MFRLSPYAWSAQYLFGFFFCYGVYLPFWALWFAYLGVSAANIGLLLGLGLGTRCVANLVITPRISRLDHLLPALRGLALLGLVFCVIHILCGGSLWGLALVTILFNLAVGPIMPISDTLLNFYAKENHLDYGRTRLWGSIAFIVGSTAVGFAVTEFGDGIIPWIAIAGMSVGWLASLRSPNIVPQPEVMIDKPRVSLRQLLKDRTVLVFLFIVALIQGSHAAYYGFSALYWQSVGHSEAMISLLWSLSVVAEIAVFAWSRRWFDHWSATNLFRLAAFGIMVRWGMTATFIELPALIVAQSLHGVTFAAAHLAAMKFIQKAPSDHMVALQALYNALPLGAVMAGMTAISGVLYAFMGVHMFWLMALMGIPVLFLKTPKIVASPLPCTVEKIS